MADFEAPSFSLGFDLDFDTQLQPPNQSPEPVTAQKVEDTEGIRPETLDPDLHVEDSPRVLKRLKRGPRNLSSNTRESVKVASLCVGDEIEELSSQDDPRRDEHSFLRTRSVYGTSKIPCCSTPTAQLKAQQCNPASDASAFSGMGSGSDKVMFPKLTISPRRFQVLDSDSDEPSTSDDLYEDGTRVYVPAKERWCNINQSMAENLQKSGKITLQTEDLWKDFTPKKSVNIPTPALDEFCEEYFRSVKDNRNLGQSKADDVCTSSSKGCHPESSTNEGIELYGNKPSPLLPAYKYFYHDDPRIQKLVHHRLPNFFPLDDANTGENHQRNAVDIDYMCQFGQDPTSANQGFVRNSKRSRKSQKQSNVSGLSEGSGGWVNPKNCTDILKNAGKRRVSAGGRSSGSWYTGSDGRKVFVTKTGQELTGRTAYRHYRKASGAGFRRSKKKAASKKKSKH